MHSDELEPASALPLSRASGVSVFLPCHNEEPNLLRVIDDFRAELGKIADDYEIIVVDDGSRDRTGILADELASRDPHIRVIHHEVNRGYGGAVISGLGAARLPYVVLCDGDGQFPASQVSRLLAKVPEHDVVVGHRVKRADPLMRRLNGLAWTLLVRLLFRVGISDIDCGLKLFKQAFVRDLDLRARGAMISTELMVKVAARGARICQVDIVHLPRVAGEQSGANLRVILRAFGELFRLFRELRRQDRTSRKLRDPSASR